MREHAGAAGLVGSAANTITFGPRRERIDWRRIASLDLHLLAHMGDVATLQTLLHNITFCDITTEDLRGVDANFLKVFQLAQLMLEYVLQSQEELLQAKDNAEDALDAARQHVKELTSKYKRAKAEGRKRKEMIETLQRLNIASQGNSGSHACRFCGKGFLNGAYLLAHLDRRHADFGPFTASDVALGGEAQGLPEPAVTREMNDLRHEVQMLRSQLDETRTELRSAKQVEQPANVTRDLAAEHQLRMELMQQQQANDARLREQERRHQDDIERLKERLDTAMQSLRDQQTQQATVAAAIGRLTEDDRPHTGGSAASLRTDQHLQSIAEQVERQTRRLEQRLSDMETQNRELKRELSSTRDEMTMAARETPSRSRMGSMGGYYPAVSAPAQQQDSELLRRLEAAERSAAEARAEAALERRQAATRAVDLLAQQQVESAQPTWGDDAGPAATEASSRSPMAPPRTSATELGRSTGASPSRAKPPRPPLPSCTILSTSVRTEPAQRGRGRSLSRTELTERGDSRRARSLPRSGSLRAPAREKLPSGVESDDSDSALSSKATGRSKLRGLGIFKRSASAQSRGKRSKSASHQPKSRHVSAKEAEAIHADTGGTEYLQQNRTASRAKLLAARTEIVGDLNVKLRRAGVRQGARGLRTAHYKRLLEELPPVDDDDLRAESLAVMDDFVAKHYRPLSPDPVEVVAPKEEKHNEQHANVPVPAATAASEPVTEGRLSLGAETDDWDDLPPPTKPARNKGRVGEVAAQETQALVRDSWGDVSEQKQLAVVARAVGGHAPQVTEQLTGPPSVPSRNFEWDSDDDVSDLSLGEPLETAAAASVAPADRPGTSRGRQPVSVGAASAPPPVLVNVETADNAGAKKPVGGHAMAPSVTPNVLSAARSSLRASSMRSATTTGGTDFDLSASDNSAVSEPLVLEDYDAVEPSGQAAAADEEAKEPFDSDDDWDV